MKVLKFTQNRRWETRDVIKVYIKLKMETCAVLSLQQAVLKLRKYKMEDAKCLLLECNQQCCVELCFVVLC